MNLSGNFKNFELSKLLQLLAMDNATGVLELRNSKDQIEIFLKSGSIVDVNNSSNPKMERVKVVLIDSGRLTQKEFNFILSEQRENYRDLGHFLLKYGILSKKSYKELLLLVTNDILNRAIGWSDGDYQFTQRDVSFSGEFAIPISIQSFLLEAYRQQDSWPLVKQYVPIMDMIFKPSLKALAEGKWDAYLKTLSPKDKAIASYIDGNNSIVAISQKSLKTVFDVSYLLAELSKRGLVVREAMAISDGDDSDEWPDGYFNIQAEPKKSIFIAVGAFVVFMIIFVAHFYSYNVFVKAEGEIRGDKEEVATEDNAKNKQPEAKPGEVKNDEDEKDEDKPVTASDAKVAEEQTSRADTAIAE